MLFILHISLFSRLQAKKKLPKNNKITFSHCDTVITLTIDQNRQQLMVY